MPDRDSRSSYLSRNRLEGDRAASPDSREERTRRSPRVWQSGRSRSRSPEWNSASQYGRKRRRSYSPGNKASTERHQRENSKSYDEKRNEGRRQFGRRSRSYSRSPSYRRSYDGEHEALAPIKRSAQALPSQRDAFATSEAGPGRKDPPVDKQKPNFATTGRLAAESNTIKAGGGQSIVLKYHEPPEARKPAPRDSWRMYVFKGSEILETVELWEQSCWLIGREAAVADLLIEHPSCSKQHAVIQFRYLEKRNEYGDKKGKVKPYVLDLESSNGTKVNGDEVPAGRYFELRDNDLLTFGHSTREYVIQLPKPGGV